MTAGHAGRTEHDATGPITVSSRALAQASGLGLDGLACVSMGSGYTIKALDESTWQGFATLVERNNGIFGGCWCMGFHADDSREPDLNRERKLARVRARAAHAALVFEGMTAWAGVTSA